MYVCMYLGIIPILDPAEDLGREGGVPAGVHGEITTQVRQAVVGLELPAQLHCF